MVPMRVIDANVPRPMSAMMLSLKYNRLRREIPQRKIKYKTKNLQQLPNTLPQKTHSTKTVGIQPLDFVVWHI